MNWQEKFKPKILERGIEYYENGNVLEIVKTASGYKAEVEGSGNNEYKVNIKIKDGKVKNMSCSCIYGQEVDYCKHMAAVLYAIDEGEEVQEEVDMKGIIDQLSVEKLRKFVLSVSESDDIQYKIKLIASSDPCSVIKRKLNRIIRKYAGQSNEIVYYDLYSFSENILQLLEQDIYEIDDMYWQSKVECICCVLDRLNELNLEDDEEDVWIMYNSCYEILGSVLSKDASRLCWMKGTINPLYFKEFIDTVNI